MTSRRRGKKTKKPKFQEPGRRPQSIQLPGAEVALLEIQGKYRDAMAVLGAFVHDAREHGVPAADAKFWSAHIAHRFLGGEDPGDKFVRRALDMRGTLDHVGVTIRIARELRMRSKVQGALAVLKSVRPAVDQTHDMFSYALALGEIYFYQDRSEEAHIVFTEAFTLLLDLQDNEFASVQMGILLAAMSQADCVRGDGEQILTRARGALDMLKEADRNNLVAQEAILNAKISITEAFRLQNKFESAFNMAYEMLDTINEGGPFPAFTAAAAHLSLAKAVYYRPKVTHDGFVYGDEGSLPIAYDMLEATTTMAVTDRQASRIYIMMLIIDNDMLRIDNIRRHAKDFMKRAGSETHRVEYLEIMLNAITLNRKKLQENAVPEESREDVEHMSREMAELALWIVKKYKPKRVEGMSDTYKQRVLCLLKRDRVGTVNQLFMEGQTCIVKAEFPDEQ